MEILNIDYDLISWTILKTILGLIVFIKFLRLDKNM